MTAVSQNANAVNPDAVAAVIPEERTVVAEAA